MAGTIVADTIQDGAGNSTSMDNAIYGSAKAWVNFNGTSGASPVIRASYNISSVVRNSTGYYTVNFTNALTDANYCIVPSMGGTTTATVPVTIASNLSAVNTTVTPTTSAFSLISMSQSNNVLYDVTGYIYVSVFR